jgi:hypothetical protein
MTLLQLQNLQVHHLERKAECHPEWAAWAECHPEWAACLIWAE